MTRVYRHRPAPAWRTAVSARDRMIPVQSVPCPVCEAPAGSPCILLDGAGLAARSHRARRTVALRGQETGRD